MNEYRDYSLSWIGQDRMISLWQLHASQASSTGQADGSSNVEQPKIFFVDSVKGSDGASGYSPVAAKATISGAISAARADKGDVILVSDKHAETRVAAIAVSKAGLSIIGCGNGRYRPVITNNPATTLDTMTVTAANCKVINIVFASSSLTSTSHINVTAADFEAGQCEFSQGASDANSIILGAGSQRAYVHDSVWRVSANGPDKAISITSATTSDGIRLERLRFFGGSVTNMWDTACVSSTVAHLDCLVNDVITDLGTIVSFTSATSTGLIKDAFGGDLGTTGNQIRVGGCRLLGGPSEGYLLKVADAAFPQGTTATVATATGGRVEIINLTAQIGTLVGGADNFLWILHPAAGTDVNVGALVDINTNGEAGSIVRPSATGLAATALVHTKAGGGNGFRCSIIMGSGVILRQSHAGSVTGTLKHDVYWRPYDTGASLV